MQINLKKRLLDIATAPYLIARFRDYYFARGKLARDPMFAALLDQKIFPDSARILDLGCGRGLLAAWLLAAEKLAEEKHWPAAVSPPMGLQFRGIELAARKALRGNRALQAVHGARVALTSGDIRTADIAPVDAITVFDVLHYISHAEQELLLDRIRAALDRGGLFVTRVGDASAGWRFQLSQLVDRYLVFLRGHRVAQTWCRPLSDWRHALETRGFTVEALPMSSGTFFANVMLICRVP